MLEKGKTDFRQALERWSSSHPLNDVIRGLQFQSNKATTYINISEDQFQFCSMTCCSPSNGVIRSGDTDRKITERT